MFIREPVVSGQFYPANKSKLHSTINSLVIEKKEKFKAKVVVSPHAGYIYSGSVAGLVYSSVIIPETAIILGPNHTGMGKRFAIMKAGEWETPLGRVGINSFLAELIASKFPKLEDDAYAHLREHSIEVQLPFLQFFNAGIKIVPICIMRATINELNLLGETIANAIREYGKEVLIVVSSDMSHYIPHDEAKDKDLKAVEKISNLDGEGLLKICEDLDITMCGLYPAIAGIAAAKSLGAKEGILLKYKTSGEVSGDFELVVGYAGIVIQ